MRASTRSLSSTWCRSALSVRRPRPQRPPAGGLGPASPSGLLPCRPACGPRMARPVRPPTRAVRSISSTVSYAQIPGSPTSPRSCRDGLSSQASASCSLQPRSATIASRILILGRRHLERVLRVYTNHYNEHRPHRALKLVPPNGGITNQEDNRPVRVAIDRRDLLGGLIHEYQRAA
jgi:hypothetical protein